MRAHYFQQSRVKQAVSVVKPHLNNDTAAFGALQELEELATMDLSVQESLQIWTISQMTENQPYDEELKISSFLDVRVWRNC